MREQTYEKRLGYISIHALRKECDVNAVFSSSPTDISIHALRKECDYKHRYQWAMQDMISIHALRKECDNSAAAFDNIQTISIHALRKECDALFGSTGRTSVLFLSTHSVRSATSYDP